MLISLYIIAAKTNNMQIGDLKSLNYHGVVGQKKKF